MSRKAWGGVVDLVTGRGSKVWEKLAQPTVDRGKTQWPKSPADQQNVGIRFDYDGEIIEEHLDNDGKKINVTYHKWQVQPNAGTIPSTWKDWRDKNGGTHAVVDTVKIKKGASKAEVMAALAGLRL